MKSLAIYIDFKSAASYLAMEATLKLIQSEKIDVVWKPYQVRVQAIADKKEIERIARKEIKDFMGKPQFKTEVQKVIADEIKKGRNTRSEIVDIVSKVMLELYKTSSSLFNTFVEEKYFCSLKYKLQKTF